MVGRVLFWFPKKVLQLALVVAAAAVILWLAFADKAAGVGRRGVAGATVRLAGRVGDVAEYQAANRPWGMYSLRDPTGVLWVRSEREHPPDRAVLVVVGEVLIERNPNRPEEAFLSIRELARWGGF